MKVIKFAPSQEYMAMGLTYLCFEPNELVIDINNQYVIRNASNFSIMIDEKGEPIKCENGIQIPLVGYQKTLIYYGLDELCDTPYVRQAIAIYMGTELQQPSTIEVVEEGATIEEITKTLATAELQLYVANLNRAIDIALDNRNESEFYKLVAEREKLQHVVTTSV